MWGTHYHSEMKVRYFPLYRDFSKGPLLGFPHHLISGDFLFKLYLLRKLLQALEGSLSLLLSSEQINAAIMYCGCLNEKGLHSLICLNSQSLVSASVWEGLGDVVLLEEVYH